MQHEKVIHCSVLKSHVLLLACTLLAFGYFGAFHCSTLLKILISVPNTPAARCRRKTKTSLVRTERFSILTIRVKAQNQYPANYYI